MCKDLYTVKVCAANQSAAEEYLQDTHGVIVKANCKKALSVLCSSVGGGSPTDQFEEVCCKIANQCETDADCGEHTDPYEVKMCCPYCMDMYGLSCETAEPVHAGFMSVGSLYNSFYGTDVWNRCKEFCVETDNGTAARRAGEPCLREPDHPPGGSSAAGSTAWEGEEGRMVMMLVAVMVGAVGVQI
eukprot:CAMPEP_0196732312 /NCGR_PEP_ID=MMETSP1091-20130531/11762_1 /TAXON_ID=302021 /ORGANISM="Rhodomonas sp., Strain CCMP768" /LENGTH=186 /DNA_ID=CAMNT_0042075559 /DNA_START=129 /DNA_END=689 /DNA_ORIENTATION=+